MIPVLGGVALLYKGIDQAAKTFVRSSFETGLILSGVWLLALILVLYGPIMISALLHSSLGDQLVGVNYFADTLLFTGAILALASVAPRERIA